MKLFYILIVFVISFTIAQSQSKQNWIEILTSEVGLEDNRGARIYINDVNGDEYTDFIYAGPRAYKEPLTLLINESDPTSEYGRKFVDYTEKSGINASRKPGMEERWSDVSVLGDIDNDGDNDLITSVFFYTLEEYIIRDTVIVDGDTTIAERIQDNQGIEVLLNDGNGNFTILENNGMSDFQFVTEKIRGGTLKYPKGLVNTTGMSLLDYDKDGNLDLVIGTFMLDYSTNYKSRQYLMKGNGDGTFTYIEHKGIENTRQPLYGINTTDFNNDGWMDIVSSPYCRSRGSIWQNNGNGTFTDVAKDVNYAATHLNRDDSPQANLCQWEALPADFDNDEDIDLLQVLVHGGYDDGVGRTTIAANQGPDNNYKFEWEIERLQRIAPEYSHLGDMGATWFDLNNDGLQDAAIGQMSYPKANIHGQERLYVLLQNDSNYFDDISYELDIFESMKEAHSMEPVDFDLDGDNDLIFSRQFRGEVDGKKVKYMKFYLMYNKIADSSNWISVKLTPPVNSNKSNIGSRIKVYSDKTVQTREILAGNGHFGGQEPYIKNFGLGKNNGNNFNRIDSIKVLWQTDENKITTIYNPPINEFINISPDRNFSLMNDDDQNEPIISFEPGHINFDSVYVETSKTKTFEIKNFGSDTLKISDIELIDTNDVYSNLKFDSLPYNITNQENMQISVDFNPKIRGIYNAVLKITSNAYNAPVRYYDIEGFGFSEQPIIAYNMNELEFPKTFVGDKDTMEFEIINKGEKLLELIGFNLDNSDNFKILDAPMIEVTLKNEKSISLKIEFIPGEEKTYKTYLNVATNAFNQEDAKFLITGTGELRKSRISSNSSKLGFFAVEIGDSSSRDFVVYSEGTKDLTINEFIFEDIGDNSFLIKDYNPPYVIEKGKSMTFDLIFSPERKGIIEGKMYIASDAVNEPKLEFEVSGIGREPSSVNNVAFGKNISIQAEPNPFTNKLNIKINNTSNFYQSGELLIVNTEGKIIHRFEEYGFKYGIKEIDYYPEHLYSGKYFLILKTKNDIIQLPLIHNK